MLPHGSFMNEDSLYSTSEWSSIHEATKVLEDKSLDYPDTYSLYYSDPDITHSCDTSLKIKKESITDLLSPGMVNIDWQNKFIHIWTNEDCLWWLVHELQDLKGTYSLLEEKMELIAKMNGAELQHMNIQTFIEIFPDCGSELYNRLQRIKERCNNSYLQCGSWEQHGSCFMPLSLSQEPATFTNLDSKCHSARISEPSAARVPFPLDSDSESMETTVAEHQPVVPEKRRPGRPRGTRKKKKPEKLGRLWEFIRDLLLNPQYNPSMICWENYDEGMFRFVHSDRVAKLWGSKKENEDMNYEKLSRAMRYYYKSQVLLPVYGKRLVYKFGPTAKGWRSENPIMRCQG